MKKWISVIFFGLLALGVIGFYPAVVSAETTKEALCNSIGSGSDCTTGSTDFTKIVNSAINIMSIIIGIVAVIMIIFAGSKYITSGGDSNKVASAKNALIYAIIGLVIVALSQVLVHFVLKTTSDSISTSEIIAISRSVV